MSSGPLEWCIDIAITVAICIGIFLGLRAHSHAPDHKSEQAPAARTTCFQRSAASIGIGAFPLGRHPA
ncbi:hypothetical protein AXW67_05440 [Bradyrhizobium neotropicale]|uniref:Uncharacterized protein n=1 Tax=Bradyrhizobium neotropicale TaxID=1497615 RepID=A0A176ZDW0_9BRAD|nr:hypothetical protein AXW67_05440 [Bradyrhizobium neotropicale]